MVLHKVPKPRAARGKYNDPGLKLHSTVPLTETQGSVFEAYDAGSNLFLFGSAGTGKTYIVLYKAFQEVMSSSSQYNKIYVVRSTVPSREMGFLPGTVAEKMAVYEAPYIGMVNKLFGRGDAYQLLVTKGILQVVPTSFLRGDTLDNCIVVCDEIENLNFSEADTVITRAGKNCKVIFCGDVAQTDLHKSNDSSCFNKLLSIVSFMEEFVCIEFSVEDIVRSGLVKSYILAKNKYEKAQLEVFEPITEQELDSAFKRMLDEDKAEQDFINKYGTAEARQISLPYLDIRNSSSEEQY